MVFSSPLFLFAFLPLCLALYYVLPARARNGVLLAFSLLFYAWGELEYCVVMLASIAGNHWCGALVARAQGTRRNRILVVGLVINLVLLGVFKYAGWLVRELSGLALALGAAPPDSWTKLEVHLPIGISFFTFQAMSYLIDVARREAEPQKRLTDFALYVALFPQLVAGPIVRYSDVARQLVKRRHRTALFASGVQRFIQGLAKKMLIANTVAVTADEVFGVPGAELTPAAAWLGTLCYTLQIYFDFSGYSDMAIGLGRMFGFRFRENFLHPYGAASVTDFWRRWHVSLSTWFRDYLYVPLGGNRLGTGRTYRNLWSVFLLCGLWHGAAWTFVVWGAFHGALLVFERAVLGRPPRGLAGHVYTLLMVMVGWVFFRAESLSGALAHLGAMVGLNAPTGAPLEAAPLLEPEVLAALLIGPLAATRLPLYASVWIQRHLRGSALAGAYDLAAAAALLALFLASAAELASGSYNPFIYFRF